MIEQYEKMMFMMHAEMNKLNAENKHLKEQSAGQQSLDSRERESLMDAL
jgi:hypothetical protein